jgi:sugar phosphate isomerase/epimerase
VEVVRDAAQPNGGLLIDAWHWNRSGTVPEDLAGVPAERILAIQLSDVAEHPMENLRQETLHHRLPPGRGFGNVAHMVGALVAKGVDAMVSVEVMSDELLSRGPTATANEVMAGAKRVLGTFR